MRRLFPARLAGAFLAGILVTGTFSDAVRADDNWTQWGGSNRDFRIELERPLEQLTIEEKWRRPLGAGYTSILCEEGRLYTMFRRGDDEYITCLNADDGQNIWEYHYAAPLFKDADESFGKGPNATPIIVQSALVTVGFNGDLICLDKITGDIRWRTNVISDLGGTAVGLGYSPSPIHYDGNIILPVGGKNRAFMALKLDDGSVAWSAQDYKNSYATPVLASMDGLDQIIFVMTDEVVAIDPRNGQEFWKFPLVNQWNTHAFVPVWDARNDVLFVSSFRQSHALQLTRTGQSIAVEKIWSNTVAGIGFTNAIRIGDVIYGSTGGSRAPTVSAIDLNEGKFLWRERGFGQSNYLSVGERIIILDERGTLALAHPTAQGLGIVGRQKILSAEKVWTVPTMIGDTIYARDQKEIVALQLK